MKKKILPAIIGLGYVGLPVFLRLQRKFKTIGYDINKKRVISLNKKIDHNREFKPNNLRILNRSEITSDKKKIKSTNFYIICVPTPIFENKRPNLGPLVSATRAISKIIKKGDIIFYESTVAPGTTEKMIRILELRSKMKEGKDFCVGYSPERINPGDKKNVIEKINKIVAFEHKNNSEILKIKKVYKNLSKKIIFSNKIKEAETAKVIENIQRDLNIAFINEILVFSRKFGLDFKKIYNLASSKWNFVRFKPGLVGGHCLPVDPYYLSNFSLSKNFKLKTVLAGREVNEKMVEFSVDQIKREFPKNFKNKKILLMGLSYKPNVSDIRNSLSLKIYQKIKRKCKNTYAFDPLCTKKDQISYKINNSLKDEKYDLAVILTKHKIFKNVIKDLVHKKIKILNLFT